MLIDEIKKGENKGLKLKEELLFYENSNFVSIVFYRPQNSEIVPKKCRIMPKNQRISIEKIIYGFIIKNNKLDLKTIENLLNIKSARARKVSSKLVKIDILEKIGKTKGSYYILKRQKD